ncbi:MAG: relaxase/mobilization nuclease domain-containing protein [Clostridia bacterium]|nr:relaxase/mobilization nuclease domain-containing protein [Clostridia bacterium]
MAIVKFITSSSPMSYIFKYVMDKEKTDETLISGVHCSPESAFEEFNFVKEKFEKTEGRQYYHIVQSFSPDDDITPEIAHEIALKFAECFPGFQIVIATHTNKDHIHTHFIMNSVSFQTGKNFHQTEKEMENRKRFSNRICNEYGFSQTETKSSYEGIPKWKLDLRRLALEAMKNSHTKEEFIEYMEYHGYKVKWEDGLKYITFTTPDGHKCRDNKLFCDQLLKINLEIYFRLGGCGSPISEHYHSHKTYIYVERGYTPGTRLFELLGNLLSIVPDDVYYYTPRALTSLDIEDIEALEELLGKRIEPNLFLHYSTREEYEESEGLSWSW